MPSFEENAEMLRQGTEHLVRMAEGLNYPWSPDENDPRKLHNSYVRSLITCYVSKFAQLSAQILDSLHQQRYLVYALAGRSLIESAATLRYYIESHYKPLLDQGALTHERMKTLLQIDDKHLRGGRFDWSSFMKGEYQLLVADAVAEMRDKNKKKKLAQAIRVEQVNVTTCIEKWAEDSPGVLVTYKLFCDLVHPNIGSTFLVASVAENGLHFSQDKGNSVGEKIVKQSFPLLLAVTHKPFGEYLGLLMCMIWADDEMAH